MAEGLTVLSGLAVRGALEKVLLPAFKRQHDLDIAVRWEPTTVIMKAIAAGETAGTDIVIVTDEATAQLAQQGKIDPATSKRLALAVLGVAVRAGAPKPDIATTDAFRKALVEARSVAYSRAGASGIHFEKMIERLGIADAVRAKATVIPAGFTAEQLVNGKADLAVQQISELMVVDGVDIVGPYPPDLQFATSFTASLLTGSKQPDKALLLLQALATAQARQAYRDTGLELP